MRDGGCDIYEVWLSTLVLLLTKHMNLLQNRPVRFTISYHRCLNLLAAECIKLTSRVYMVLTVNCPDRVDGTAAARSSLLHTPRDEPTDAIEYDRIDTMALAEGYFSSWRGPRGR